MRIGLYYRWFKEGKLDCSQQEMSDLWNLYERLNPRSTNDRKIADGYTYFLDFIHNPEKFSATEQDVQDCIDGKIEKLNQFFREEREDPKHNHLYLLC